MQRRWPSLVVLAAVLTAGAVEARAQTCPGCRGNGSTSPYFAPACGAPSYSLMPGCCQCQPSRCDHVWDGYCQKEGARKAGMKRPGPWYGQLWDEGTASATPAGQPTPAVVPQKEPPTPPGPTTLTPTVPSPPPPATPSTPSRLPSTAPPTPPKPPAERTTWQMPSLW